MDKNRKESATLPKERFINVLFLGGAKRVSLGRHFIETGKQLGYSVKLFSYELDKKVPIASIATVLLGKRWRDNNVVEDLLQVIKEYSINIILPFVDPAIEIAAIIKQRCTNVFVPTCGENICLIMFDKKKSEEWFISKNIPIPPSYSINDIKEYPLIIKPRNGSASKGIKIIENESELKAVGNIEDYVIQKFIKDHNEYTVDCYIDKDGDIVSIVPRVRLVVAGGEVMNSKTIRNSFLIRVSTNILNSGLFRGPVTIQFIEDKLTNHFFVMEINPRLGGGVITSIAAGANIPLYILQEYFGKKPLSCNDWKDETLMVRYFDEVVFYADNN